MHRAISGRASSQIYFWILGQELKLGLLGNANRYPQSPGMRQKRMCSYLLQCEHPEQSVNDSILIIFLSSVELCDCGAREGPQRILVRTEIIEPVENWCQLVLRVPIISCCHSSLVGFPLLNHGSGWTIMLWACHLTVMFTSYDCDYQPRGDMTDIETGVQMTDCFCNLAKNVSLQKKIAPYH